jgi:hypothetical protein
MKAVPVKTAKKGCIPAGYANGGKVKAKPFSGVDTRSEEVAEGRSVRSGKLPVKGYLAREAAESQREKEPMNRAKTARTGAALASGKLSPAAYAAMDAKEQPKRRK